MKNKGGADDVKPLKVTRYKGNGDGRSPMYPLLYNATNNRQK